MTDPWEAQREALGAFIREQRKLPVLELDDLTDERLCLLLLVLLGMRIRALGLP